MMRDLDALIQDIHTRARELGQARNRESMLEDARALVKRDAIGRLLTSGVATSPTAAEKIVEADEQYQQHRAVQRDAVVTSFTAAAAYEAARLRAWAAVRPAEEGEPL